MSPRLGAFAPYRLGKNNPFTMDRQCISSNPPDPVGRPHWSPTLIRRAGAEQVIAHAGLPRGHEAAPGVLTHGWVDQGARLDPRDALALLADPPADHGLVIILQG